MKNLFVFLLFLLPFTFSFTPAANLDNCDCPGVSNEQGAQSGRDVILTWDGAYDATEYKVWYTRGGYTSPSSYPTGTTFTYYNLSSGSYFFHIQTVCGETESEYVGTVDVIID